MNRIAIILTMSAATILASCSGGKSGGDVPLSRDAQNSSRMPAGASVTPAPDGQPGSPTTIVAPKYIANQTASAASFLTPTDIGKRIGLDLQANAPLVLQRVQLKRWSDTDAYRSGVRDYLIDQNRLVYEVTTNFKTSYGVRGNVWSSGMRRFIVDAATGDALLSQTLGNQTVNAGKRMAALAVQHRRGFFIANHVRRK